MTKKPTVSINLCCYNGEKYLREALESIIAQTYKDWELVIINDGSRDSTESIIKKYINKGYPIIYHYQENHGLGYSRNEALKLSSGELIAFIDQDDMWMPEKIEKQVSIFQCDPAVSFVYSNFLMLNVEKQKKYLVFKKSQPSGYVFESFLYHYPVGILTAMVRKDAVLSLSELFDQNLHLSEEYDLFMRLLYVFHAVYLPEPLAVYRIHARMQSVIRGEEYPDEIEHVMKKIKRLYPGVENKYADAFKHNERKWGYVRSKICILQGNYKGARRCIAPYKWHNIKFIAIYILALIPFRLKLIYRIFLKYSNIST